MATDPYSTRVAEPLWRYDRFVKLVGELASLGVEEAEVAIRAVLETLAEHLADEQREQVAVKLPKAVRTWLKHPAVGEQLKHGAFLYRVAEREGVTAPPVIDELALQAAERHTRAVFGVVRLMLEPDEVEAIIAQLPPDERRLMREPSRHPRRPIAADAFVGRVAETAVFSRERALHATDAVMETLGERLAAGEVEDLERLVPGELAPALELGKLHDRKAERFDAGEFATRVAERTGENYEDALDLTRAVFAAMREKLPERELEDILAELPQGYDELVGRKR